MVPKLSHGADLHVVTLVTIITWPRLRGEEVGNQASWGVISVDSFFPPENPRSGGVPLSTVRGQSPRPISAPRQDLVLQCSI
jgi:hypothetical protein